MRGRPLRLARVPHRQLLRRRAPRGRAARRATASLAIVGANSSELSLAVAEEAEARRHPAGHERLDGLRPHLGPATGRVRPFVFRMCASDDVIGALLAVFARDRLGARRVAILYEVGRSYSAQLARSFKRRFDEPAAGRAASRVLLPRARDRLPPAAAADPGVRPDVVFMPGSFPDATLVAVQARAGRAARHVPRRRRLVEPAALPARRAAGRRLLRRAVLAGARSSTGSTRRRVGSEPPGCRAVLAYDTVRVIAAGLAAARGALRPRTWASGLAAHAPPAARRRRARARSRA